MKASNSEDPQNRMTSVVESHSCRCSSTSNDGNRTVRNNVLHTHQKLPNTRSNSSKVIGVFSGTRTGKVWYRSCPPQTERSMGLHGQKMAQTFEEASHPICCCDEPLSKEDLKSKKGRQTFHFQSTTQTKNHHAFYLGMQPVVHLRCSM